MAERLPAVAARMAFSILLVAAFGARAGTGLPDLCDYDEPDARSESLFYVQVHRGPFDFKGARIVGCAENLGDTELDGFRLSYDNIRARGGGGGGISITVPELAPASGRCS